METYFNSFHEDEQFSTNLLLSNVDEIMEDQLTGLESKKPDENVSWGVENVESQNLGGKEDFQQIMSDWQQHIGFLQSTGNEDLGLGLDSNLDVLNTYSSSDLFGELESPILSKALKYPGQKCAVSSQSLYKSLGPTLKDSFLDNLDNFNESTEHSQKLCGLIKAEPNFIRKVTLVNGEREILGKNIIELHCLNEIKENPDENCQVTSTVINGKRYKIIIKPKSLKVKKLSKEKIRKTLIKKLMQRHLLTKVESKKDEIISEMCNGNYDVPILNSDLLPSWEFAALDYEYSSQESNETDNTAKETEAEPEKKIQPLRLKIPKVKKHRKSCVKSDEEVDVESNNDKVVEGHTLSTLLKNFEEEVAKLEKNNGNIDQECLATDIDENEKEFSSLTSENIKNSLPKEMIEKIEALKRKKDCRIPIIQAMPTKKAGKNGTRMQDAIATMNRNKLLKIVSNGDLIQMDHDYCSTFTKTIAANQQLKKNIILETNLAEKNPKKDSGMESGDVSDASEGPNTPDSLQYVQTVRQVNNKVLEECRRIGGHSSVTKAAIAFFRATNAATVNGNLSSSDPVKTKTVSNGNKALTNNAQNSDCYSDSSCKVPSDTNVKNKYEEDSLSVDAEAQKISNDTPLQPVQNERPKKKLKLEEYLNRKHMKGKERERNSNCCCVIDGKVNKNDLLKSRNESAGKSREEIFSENTQKSGNYQIHTNEDLKKEKSRKYWKGQNRRSSSASSAERVKEGRKSRSRSKSRSRWRRSRSKSSSSKRRGREKFRRSESGGRRKRGFWSSSLSRSSSRESSTSSDYSGNKHCGSSSVRCHRRSRSRSVSWGRSKSQNRGCKRHRPGYCYYDRTFNNGRSKSPFCAYSTREKQRQIEERRVIYVGRIEEGMTNAKLRERFSIFGPIIDISLHFREYGDNYGFVTYAYKADAYDAVEHGNDDPSLPRYDLCFGGRRGFCKEKYADLDGMPTSYSGFNDTPFIQNSKDSFDLLLKEAQAKLKKRKKQQLPN